MATAVGLVFMRSASPDERIAVLVPVPLVGWGFRKRIAVSETVVASFAPR